MKNAKIFIKLCNEVCIDCNEILKRTPPVHSSVARVTLLACFALAFARLIKNAKK